MSNYVRADFCVERPAHKDEFHNLLLALQGLGCRYNYWRPDSVSGYLQDDSRDIDVQEQATDRELVPAKLRQFSDWLARPGYLNVKLGWRIEGVVYTAYLSVYWPDTIHRGRVAFAVEENLFLPGEQFYYAPDGDPRFHVFKDGLSSIVRHMRPTFGAVDFEADLICWDGVPTMDGSFASWGNYFSNRMLNRWAKTDLTILLATVDEADPIDDLGLLTFIHPLAGNQNWTERHVTVDALLKRNPLPW